MRKPHLVLFPLVFLLVLNPYTIWGRPGIPVAVALAAYGVAGGLNRLWVDRIALPLGAIFLIGLWGAFQSQIHLNGQLNHPGAVVSLIFLLLCGAGLFRFCRAQRIGLDGLVACVLLTIIVNCVVILVEVYSPEVRAGIESILVKAGNINYAEGFRFRGLSASGGAGLSVTLPMAMLTALYLFGRERIGALVLVTSVVVLFAAGLVIGRTGLLLMPIAAVLYLVLERKRFWSARRAIRLVGVVVSVALLSPLFYRSISDYFATRFGPGFMSYAFDFVLQGEEGFDREGTIETVGSFLEVLPLRMPEAVTGYGFFGGGYFRPWTDSGYSRMFLSVGFPLGIVFYALLLRVFAAPQGDARRLLWSMLIVLLVVEAKESLLISGNGSRVFLLLLTYAQLEYLSSLADSAGRVALPAAKYSEGITN